MPRISSKLVATAALCTALAVICVGALIRTHGTGGALTGAARAAGRHGDAPADSGIQTLRIPIDADAAIDSAQPDTPLGATRAMTIGYAVGAGRSTWQILLHFPLPALLPGSTIVSATLELDTVAVRGQSEIRVGYGYIGESWIESDVTWSTRPPVLDPNWLGLVGPDLGPRAVDMKQRINLWRDTGRTNHGLAFWVVDGECEAGRTRTYASRETLPGAGAPPMLVIAYVGPGTPHPFPSSTPTDWPTATPTPTGTVPPTPSATTTSTFGLSQGKAGLIRPSEGARLAQPIGDEGWVFEWQQPNRGPCAYTGAQLTLIPPIGAAITREVTELCTVFRADGPLAAGRWQWWVQAHCAHGPTSPSDRGSFMVAEAPATPTPAITPTATTEATSTATPSRTLTPVPAATAVPVLLPYAGRQAVAATSPSALAGEPRHAAGPNLPGSVDTEFAMRRNSAHHQPMKTVHGAGAISQLASELDRPRRRTLGIHKRGGHP